MYTSSRWTDCCSSRRLCFPCDTHAECCHLIYRLLPTTTTYIYYHLHLPTYYSMSKTSRYMWNQSVTISIVIYQSSYLSLSLLSNSHCFSLFKSLCVSFFDAKPEAPKPLSVDSNWPLTDQTRPSETFSIFPPPTHAWG